MKMSMSTRHSPLCMSLHLMWLACSPSGPYRSVRNWWRRLTRGTVWFIARAALRMKAWVVASCLPRSSRLMTTTTMTMSLPLAAVSIIATFYIHFAKVISKHLLFFHNAPVVPPKKTGPLSKDPGVSKVTSLIVVAFWCHAMLMHHSKMCNTVVLFLCRHVDIFFLFGWTINTIVSCLHLSQRLNWSLTSSTIDMKNCWSEVSKKDLRPNGFISSSLLWQADSAKMQECYKTLQEVFPYSRHQNV